MPKHLPRREPRRHTSGHPAAAPRAARPAPAPLPPAAVVPGPGAGVSLAFATLLILGLPALARADSSNWTWGLNLWRYLPAWSAWAALAVGLAALAMGIARAFGHAGKGAAEALQGVAEKGAATPSGDFFSPRGRPLRALLCVAAATCFWVLRERAHFLSDNLLRLRAVDRMATGNGEVPARMLHAAPLDYLLTVLLPVRLAAEGVLTSFQAAQLVPCLVGALFVAGALRLASLASSTSAGRAAVLATLLAGGYLQLFAGYCKGYGLLLSLLLWWYAEALAAERSGGGPARTTVLFGLVALTHRTGLLLLPAQLLLLARAWRGPAGRRPGPATWAALAFAAACVAALAAGWRDAAGNDLSLASQLWGGARGPGNYPLFSLEHLSHVLNDQFLVAPAALAGLLLLPWVARRGPGWATLWVAGAPFLLLALLVRSLYPFQGPARDRDGFASAGLFLALLAARQMAATVEAAPRLRALAAAAVLACALHAGAWITVNADTGRALARVDELGRGAPPMHLEGRAMLFEYLGEMHQLRREPAASAEAYLRAAALVPNARFLAQAAERLWEAGKRDSAELVFRRAAERDPAFRERMLAVAARALARHPGDARGLLIQRAAQAAAPGAKP